MPTVPQDTSSNALVLWIIGVLVVVIIALYKTIFISNAQTTKDLAAAAEVIKTLQAEVAKLSRELGEAVGELKYHKSQQ